MRMFLLLAMATGLLQAQAAPPAQAPAPPPGTDIYLVPISGGLAALKTATPAPISTAPGYDNQPNFSADGSRILFAANRDGKQIDVYVFDRGNGRVTHVEFDDDKSQALYKIKVRSAEDGTLKMKIAAAGGRVLSSERDDERGD